MKGKLIFGIVIFIVLILIGTDAIYIVNSGEQAIVERFGERIDLIKEAGFRTKIPLIDRVVKQNTEKLYTFEYGYRISQGGDTKNPAIYTDMNEEAIMLTKGSYLVNVEAAVQIRIFDLAEFYYNVDDQEGTLKLALESVIRRNVQNKDLDDALLNKEKISSEVLPELKRKINEYGLGYEIKALEIQNITVPDQVKETYDDVNNAKNEREQLIETAKKYTNEKLPQARAKAYKMVQEAEGYMAGKISQAKGDVENFNQVYEKYKVASDITKTRLRLETMEKILSTVKEKYIIDIDGDGVVKYLPINPSSKQGGNK